ncbi:MAG: hypothetical protein NTW86_18730 [Candidatus Sumerlaeota bacterium]|nr:hypothetical protein [Candidatus Sumerlaeota bacterium]
MGKRAWGMMGLVGKSVLELALVVALVVGIGWGLMTAAQLRPEPPTVKEKRSEKREKPLKKEQPLPIETPPPDVFHLLGDSGAAEGK